LKKERKKGRKGTKKERMNETKKEGRKEGKKETHREGLVSLLHLSITKCLQICKIQQCTLPLNVAGES
jgi:hypothetical protein